MRAFGGGMALFPRRRKPLMEILQTRVFPRIDRDAVLPVLLADRRQGMPLLFGLADKQAARVLTDATLDDSWRQYDNLEVTDR